MASPDSTTSKRVRKATVAAPNLSLKKAYQAGELIAGRYCLKELLGEGGMGAVWKAHNSTLEIDVAIKLIRAEEADSDAVLGDRLLQEARAAARLGHPAIARVFDFGATDRGDPFIAMELLQGEDLAQALARRGRISVTKAVATLLPIAHALDAAHAKGIVHRDIKPENIFLARAEDGRVQPKVVDFGIAKTDRIRSHRLTQTGTMLGSPLYMSPEQARGDDVDHLADVWALCVVLYEMVTGRTPFEGKNYNALLYSIIADEPPPITSIGAGDDELWAILRRGFEKDPDQRWQSIRELGTELSKWLITKNQHEDITGASLSAQWLRRVASGTDMLASMMPPPDEDLPVSDFAKRARDRTVVEPREVPESNRSLTRRLPSLRTKTGRRRLVAVALASALAGAIAVVFVAVRAEREAASAAADANLAREAADALAVQEHEANVASLETVPRVADPPATEAVAHETEPARVPTSDVSALPNVAETTTTDSKIQKSPKGVRPAKKSKLKNPFD